MKSIPEKFAGNAQFLRYYDIWCEHEASIVFVPLAQMLRDAGYLKEASEVCEASLPHHPDSISGRLLLASIYWDLGKKEEADVLAREILKRMPDHPEAIRFMQGVGKPGVRSESQGADDPLVTSTMADILISQGAYGDAAEVLRKLVESNPDDRALRNRLVELEELLSGEEKTVT